MVNLPSRPLNPQGKIYRCPLDMTLTLVRRQEMSLSETELTSCRRKTNRYEKCRRFNATEFGTLGHSSFACFYYTVKISNVYTDIAGRVATGYGLQVSGDRIPVEARISALVQTGSGAHPVACTVGTSCLPGVRAAGAWR